MASLFKVKALYDFEAKEEDDLGFPGGQVIDVTEEVDDNWLEGSYTDASGGVKSGIFPREFVEKYEPPVPTRPTRPTRPKQESTAPATVPAPASAPAPDAPAPATTEEPEEEDEVPAPAVPAVSKPQPPPVSIPATSTQQEELRSPPSASNARNVDSLAAPKPTPAEPVKETPTKKPPPPVAAKSNSFKDRIAAFNKPAAAPVAPIVPGGPKPGVGFIKKPFVAPPPMANSYVPPPKPTESVHRPYIREEDPEIRQRQEEDRAGAEAAALTVGASEQQEDEDAPKPQTLKERIARLQAQQAEQAQRRSEGLKKEKKVPPAKKPPESSEHAAEEETEGEELTRERSADMERRSVDMPRDRARVPSSHRKPSAPMSPIPAVPESELVSDGNEADQSAAGETTEDDTGTIGPDDSDERHAPLPPPRAAATAPPKKEPDVGDEEDTTEVGEDDDEDSMDEETRRRMELRERMAKMSGGMGMAGMFGPPGGMPLPGAAMPKKRKEKKPSEEEAPSSPPLQQQQRIPMIPVPGLQRVTSPASSLPERNEAEDRDEDAPTPSRKSLQENRSVPPPVPKDSRPSQERGAPPPVPNAATQLPPRSNAPESRPVPQPPPHAAPQSPGPGSESDDETSILPSKSSAETGGVSEATPLPMRTNTGGAPPVPGSAAPQSPENRRASYFGIGEFQSVTSDKRASRPPPPVPGSPLTSPRPPPPAPPSQPPSRVVTGLQAEGNERGESDYEGDYDTDIASSAKHKDALKAHVREDSYDGSITADDLSSPPQPPPHTSAPRAVPPPPPAQALPKSRPSMDAPRAVPPVPPSRPVPDTLNAVDNDEDYDPYRYESGQNRGPIPSVPEEAPVSAPPMPPRESGGRENSVDDLYATTPTRKSVDQPARGVPAPPPTETPPARAPPRQSLDVHRSNTTARRSMDQPRPSTDSGQMAKDIDLAESTTWWTAPNALPPSLQARNGVDILSESEESTTSKRGGRSTISKDIYILYLDYSQTIITARYDSANPADVQLEQQHRSPPPKLRQDQLEAYWNKFGRNIAETVNSLGHSKKDTTVGDGAPTSLPVDLIKSNPAALLPIGNKAYGAVVYANLANASTQQFDEIRPGDIVTLRNTRFEGTHGTMKHKYREEYGPMHVAIVEEWDGTRRSIRAWEQGRSKSKVRSEKFRLGDLRSGEVKVWRIVGRDWVEWETSS